MLETTPSALDAATTIRKRKLIEVALPLHAINAAARKEKTTTHGHPSTFHLWWGHRPYSVARAVIFASLVDDPSARPDLYPSEHEQTKARESYFQLIEQLIQWKNVTNASVLAAAKKQISQSVGNDRVTVVDPFSGRGTIPLEAKRLGCAVLGTDLNPVAVLISKSLVETPGKFSHASPVHPSAAGSVISHGVAAIAFDAVAYGKNLLDSVKKQTLSLYPELEQDDGRWTVTAWLWARSIECPNPVCGRSQTPLVKSSVLSTKSKPRVHMKPRIDLKSRKVAFDPSRDGSEPFSNVISKRGATCIFCRELIPLKYIRDAACQKGLGKMLMGAVLSRGGRKKFVGSDAIASTVVEPSLPESLLDVELTINSRHMGPPVYGLSRHRDLYTHRQLKTLATLASSIKEIRDVVLRDAVTSGLPKDGIRLENGGRGADAYADAIATYLAIAVSRLADRCSTLAFWQVDETIGHVFVRPALPMTWDFVEVNPFSDSAGSFANCIDSISKTIVKLPDSDNASIEMADARFAEYPANSVVITDPPYYDNVPYADISEYFYVWLREGLGGIWQGLFASLGTPKLAELTFDKSRHDGDGTRAHAHFTDGFIETFRRWRQVSNTSYPSLVFYAFKATSKVDSDEATGVVSAGWESILTSLVTVGYQVTGTWPIGTERGNRFRSIDSNALGSSIVLVIRPREDDARSCSRTEFIRELRSDLPVALQRLRELNLAATDLQQAAIGPGMAIFSRYKYVLEPDDSHMTMRTALAIINDELAQVLLGEMSDVDPETHFALSWFDEFGYTEGSYSRADIVLRAKNARIESLLTAGVVVSESGRVRLRSPQEVTPFADISHFPLWAQAIHLVASLTGNEGSEEEAASLLRSVPASSAERIRDIAYHCYLVCDKAKRASEALEFNSVVEAWPDLLRLANERGGDTLL